MRILIADDSAISRRLLEATLRQWGYDVVVADDGAKAWRLLQESDAPQLVILDWMMPEMDGLEVCRRIRGCDGTPYTYVILLTAKNQKEDVVYAMDAGADDMIAKPFDPGELRVRVRAGERILDLQARLLAAQELLRLQATHDSLSGLWNHGAIMELLKREFARSGREQQSLGVIMGDLDHFKRVNDTCGHPTGDAVLKEAAMRLRKSTREYDGIGRYGGEEFLIVAPNCDLQRTAELAERLRKSIVDHPFPTPDGMITMTMSLGVTADRPDTAGTGCDVAHLIGAADEALYEAKRQGRNRIAIAKAERATGAPSSTAVQP